jgi:AcrR family transcriptional regulator
MTLASGTENMGSVQVRTKTDLVEEFRTGTIQEAALRVISRRGLAGTSMQAVAQEAGIAKGTIYLYFKNREDLVERTADWAVSQLTKRLAPLLAEPNREAFDVRLRGIVETKIEFFHQHREFFRLYRAACSRERGREECSRKDQYQEYLAALAGVLRRAMRRGEVRKLDPERLAFFIAEGVHAVIIRRLSEPKSPPPVAEADGIVSLLLEGLRPRGARA